VHVALERPVVKHVGGAPVTGFGHRLALLLPEQLDGCEDGQEGRAVEPMWTRVLAPACTVPPGRSRRRARPPMGPSKSGQLAECLVGASPGTVRACRG
jgi:hypothetical protein